MTSNSGLFGLIVLALDIWAIVRILSSAATAGAKTLWILLVIFLPIVGLVIWAIAGPGGGGGGPAYRS